VRNEMVAMERSRALPEATRVGALSAQLRRPRPRSGMSAQRRLRSYWTEGSRPQRRRGSSWRVGGYRCSLDAWVRSNPTPSSFRPLHEPSTCRPDSPAHPILRARKSESARDADSVGRGREGRRRTILSGRKPEGKPFNRLPCFVI
jgi:hypothetical protein